MKTRPISRRLTLPAVFAALLLTSAVCLPAFAQGTAFTYQGRLNPNVALANGAYDFQFALFDAATGGSQIGSALATNVVAVNNVLLTSDRKAKERFPAVDSQAMPDKVVALPVSEWQFKNDQSTRHIGPMAQDFYAAFNVGPDDKHIATIDESGVALAAIRGLNEKVEVRSQKSEDRNRKLEERLQQKETEITDLKQSVNELKELVNQMNHKLNGGTK